MKDLNLIQKFNIVFGRAVDVFLNSDYNKVHSTDYRGEELRVKSAYRENFIDHPYFFVNFPKDEISEVEDLIERNKEVFRNWTYVIGNRIQGVVMFFYKPYKDEDLVRVVSNLSKELNLFTEGDAVGKSGKVVMVGQSIHEIEQSWLNKFDEMVMDLPYWFELYSHSVAKRKLELIFVGTEQNIFSFRMKMNQWLRGAALQVSAVGDDWR